MAEAVGDFVRTRLAAWGVATIFGYPSDGLLGSMQRLDLPVAFIRVRHEEMAAFMGPTRSCPASASRPAGAGIGPTRPEAPHLGGAPRNL